MKKLTLRKLGIAGLTLASMNLTACSNFTPNTAENKASVGASTASVNDAISVTPATAAQCANGGSVYHVFVDANADGIFDSGDSLINEQVVCNGANGATGLSTLFSMHKMTVDATSCASLSGLQINSGLDLNSDGVLQASEITQTQLVCDGATGATGAAGSNGLSMVFVTAPAASCICPAGGTTILMALDTAGTGVWTMSDANQQSATICNGKDGLSAAPSPYATVEMITPCGSTVANKEILMRLANGTVLASVSQTVSGTNTRLSLVNDGTYIDTDGSQCVFSLATSADGSHRSISWGGKVQETWAMSK